MFRLPWRRPVTEMWETQIKPPRYTFTGHDEALHVKAMKRREIAESIRKRSALVSSGSSAGTVLKMARKLLERREA